MANAMVMRKPDLNPANQMNQTKREPESILSSKLLTENIFKSKAIKTAVSFATGFGAGYLAGYWAINPRHEYATAIAITSAITLGLINTARSAYIPEEENRKDTTEFFKWGIIPGVLVCSTTFLTIESLAVGTVFGVVGVIKRRIKENSKQ